MKNLLLLFFLIILFSIRGNAQKNIHFGVKGGLNLTNMSSDNFAENDMKTGYHLGALAEFGLGDKFSIQPEVLFSTQGTNAKVMMDGGGPKPEEYSLDYIQVPVAAKVYIISNLSIEIGPSFNFLVKKETPDYESDFVENFEFGGVLGASYKLVNGLFASIRYTQGFTNVFDEDEYFGSSHNMGFQLGIGYLFK